MAGADLRLKFRQSKDYTFEMLIRDLIEYGQEANARAAAAELRLSELEGKRGIWTPDLKFGGAKVGITYSGLRGIYRKVGTLVYIEFEIALSSKGSSVGNVSVEGLPFAPKVGTGTVTQALPSYYTGMTLSAGAQFSFLGYSGAPVNGFSMRQLLSTGATTMTDANFTNASRIIASGTYESET